MEIPSFLREEKRIQKEIEVKGLKKFIEDEENKINESEKQLTHA